MGKQYKWHELNQCALYKCGSKKRLGKLLDISKTEMMHIERWARYAKYSLPKEDGTNRNITEPYKRLKIVQRRLLDLLASVSRPEWVFAGTRGKSYVDNAAIHQQSDFLLALDIKKFYDNCKREYIYQFFNKDLMMPGDVAAVATEIVTFESGIPTGSPTSQMLAYWAYRQMFDEIDTEAKKVGCKFSLFVDDMTFSSDKSFDPRKLERQVDIILRRYSHKLKQAKTQYYSRRRTKVVTGVAITPKHELKVPNSLGYSIIKKSRNMKNGKIDMAENMQKTLGQINAARQIEKDAFKKTEQEIKAL